MYKHRSVCARYRRERYRVSSSFPHFCYYRDQFRDLPHHCFKWKSLKESEIIISTISGPREEDMSGPQEGGGLFLLWIITSSLWGLSCDRMRCAASGQASVSEWPSSSCRVTVEMGFPVDVVRGSAWRTAAWLSKLSILPKDAAQGPALRPRCCPGANPPVFSVGLTVWTKLEAKRHNAATTRGQFC